MTYLRAQILCQCSEFLGGSLSVDQVFFFLWHFTTNPYYADELLSFGSSHPPSKEEIAELERRCNNNPLKFCNVDPSGRVSFFAFNRVELPVLP